jgi:hypothetical protein
VIVVVPAVTPVTTPEADTVATAVLLDVQVPPVVADANCVVNPEQTIFAPVIAATVGNAFTVTTAVAVFVQLFEFVYVYVIVAVPALTPVTDPVDELTIAVAVFELDHVPPVVVFAKLTLDPSHTDVVPVIAATVGNAFTVTVVAVLVALHPLLFVTVNV